MYMPTNTSRSMLEKAKRPGDLRRSTFSWCRSARISASSAARDRKRPAKAHQISLQRSIIAASINRFARAYQPTLVFGRDRLTSYGVTFHSYTEPHLADRQRVGPQYPARTALVAGKGRGTEDKRTHEGRDGPSEGQGHQNRQTEAPDRTSSKDRQAGCRGPNAIRHCQGLGR